MSTEDLDEKKDRNEIQEMDDEERRLLAEELGLPLD